MTTIDDLLAQVSAREKTVKILLDQQLVDEHARRDAELARELKLDEQENRDPVGPGLAERLVEFEAQIEAAKVEFRFRAIGKKAWEVLLAAHPPTRDQLKLTARLDNNPETFPQAAIAASCVEPALAADEWAVLLAKLDEMGTTTQFDMLYMACLDANVGATDNPKSLVAPSIARVSAALEAMHVNTGSPDLSSLDE